MIVDSLAPQVDAFTWFRYERTFSLLPEGQSSLLEIGTGGGIETLRILSKGYRVTSVEIESTTLIRTAQRIERSGFSSLWRGVRGHVNNVQIDGVYSHIVILEVLEHIMDDEGALRKLRNLTESGGRLFLSTPTRSHGMLPGDQLSSSEDGGHVRPGYHPQELQDLLARCGFRLEKQVLCGSRAMMWQHRMERVLRTNFPKCGMLFGLLCRPLMPFLDKFLGDYNDQIVIAVAE